MRRREFIMLIGGAAVTGCRCLRLNGLSTGGERRRDFGERIMPDQFNLNTVLSRVLIVSSVARVELAE